MKTLVTEFISLDGVVQAPGGAREDTDGGFTHGRWSMKYFDPVVMGGMYADLVDELLLTIEPITPSAGKTIFAHSGKAVPFTLESTARASTGAHVSRYVRA
ncbi:MAG: hypothetical protein KJZ83_03410 [Burkholderiaceae bacterium]|nr:hypothetical protein [Burkholderiaceae bacterium]